MSHFLSSLFLSAVASLTTPAQPKPQPLEVVDFVEIDRYLGEWYEIASIPKIFQLGCKNSRAEYSLLPSGAIRVVNSCEVAGHTRTSKGKAWVVDTDSNAKLKVQFFWPFRGDYWIIELDEDYQYAVVGDPSRDSLWILSREPSMSPELYNTLLTSIEKTHLYDIEQIVKTSEL